MKLTLETVRDVLKDALGFDSYIAGFITEVREDPSSPTANITKDGLLRYNPQFAAQHITCKQDLFSLCMHEVLHPMFGHFVFRGGEIENIAADAIINAVISTVFSTKSHRGHLFEKFYPPSGLPGLLRPCSRMHTSSLSRLYDALYESRHIKKEDSITTGELIQSLKILVPSVPPALVLFGSHGAEGQKGEGLGGLPKETLTRMAEDIQHGATECASRSMGYSETLMDLLTEALKTHLSIRRVLLERFLTKRKVDRFKETLHARRLSTSPIPIHPSKRDLVLLAAGIYPFHFHNTVAHPRQQERGLAIYLDVSGSVNDFLPQILGVLKGLRKEIKSIFLFSNKVVETSFESVLKGHVQTTYGTDFDCIAESVLERDFRKAVIVTDGFASMKPELSEKLKEHRLRTLTVLFGNSRDCDDFAAFGDVVQLEDICEER